MISPDCLRLPFTLRVVARRLLGIAGVRPLSCDPFPDVRRAVSELRSIRFTHAQEFDGLAVHEKDTLEIEDHRARLLFQQGPEHVHVIPCDPATDAQDRKILSDNKPVDSAAHSRVTVELFCSLPFPNCLTI